MAAAEAAQAATASDEQLVRRVAAGDRQAFDLLYERYFPRVFGFVRRRLSNRDDVEETVQEVFASVFSCLGSYRGDAPFAAWVLGVTRRTIAGRFKKKRHPTVPLAGGEEPDELDATDSLLRREPTPLEHYECGERMARIESAAHHDLTSEQRRLFELHHLRHRSIQDIARELRKSEDAVKSHLYRARKLLLAR